MSKHIEIDRAGDGFKVTVVEDVWGKRRERRQAVVAHRHTAKALAKNWSQIHGACKIEDLVK